MNEAQIEEQLRQLNSSIAETQSRLAPTDELLRRAASDDSWSDMALMLSAGILLFAVVILGLATYLIRNGTPTDAVLKLFGAILIVVSAIFLIVAGYSDQQIAPVIGLLGTIAGYLLGKETSTPPTATQRLTDK